jgi:hypothetical protein
MININVIFDVIKKQGATGVLALWLFYTHTEVQELKARLYDCYGKNNNTATRQIADSTNFAILPKDELNETE